MKNVFFWGASGQAIVLEEILSNSGYKIIALFDKNSLVKAPFASPIFHKEDDLFEYFQNFSDIHYVVAIGGAKGNDRLAIHNYLRVKNLIPISVIHRKAILAENISIGEGCQILIGAVIATRVKLGISVIVNSSASIDHECFIDDGSHIAPGVKIAGNVNIGKNCFIGTGSIIGPRVTVGSNTTIGAGSVVLRDIPEGVIAYGAPVKIIRDNMQIGLGITDSKRK